MPGPLARALDEDFGPRIIETFQRTLSVSYRYAQLAHLPDAGSNDATFGFNLYWFNVRQFSEVTRSERVGFKVLSERPEFRMRVGRFIVACHRVGSEATDPITHCFPRNPNGPGRLAAQNAIQLCLDLPIEDDPSVPTNVIVAHMGSSSEGLQAVYLAVPAGTSDGGRVNEWRYTKLLWRAPALLDVPEVPAPVDLRPPTLTFRDSANVGDTPA